MHVKLLSQLLRNPESPTEVCRLDVRAAWLATPFDPMRTTRKHKNVIHSGLGPYDWTTGAPHDENEWKKYRVVPVRTPRVPFVMLILIGLEAKGLLAFQGRRGIASVVRWNVRPVIFGVEQWLGANYLFFSQKIAAVTAASFSNERIYVRHCQPLPFLSIAQESYDKPK